MVIPKTKIHCDWKQCSSWVESQKDGSLLIERYDFSGHHGGDESTYWQLQPEAVALLLDIDGILSAFEDGNVTLELLVQAIDEHAVPHRKWRDSMV